MKKQKLFMANFPDESLYNTKTPYQWMRSEKKDNVMFYVEMMVDGKLKKIAVAVTNSMNEEDAMNMLKAMYDKGAVTLACWIPLNDPKEMIVSHMNDLTGQVFGFILKNLGLDENKKMKDVFTKAALEIGVTL